MPNLSEQPEMKEDEPAFGKNPQITKMEIMSANISLRTSLSTIGFLFTSAFNKKSTNITDLNILEKEIGELIEAENYTDIIKKEGRFIITIEGLVLEIKQEENNLEALNNEDNKKKLCEIEELNNEINLLKTKVGNLFSKIRENKRHQH